MKKKSILFSIIFNLILVLSFYGSSVFAFTVLIDPGHGGNDSGAKSIVRLKLKGKKYKIHHLLEKNLSLIIAKRLFNELKRRGYQARLTRSIDRTVTLDERTSLAQKIKADIFISIHLNSSTKKKPRGFETYYLSHHKNKAIKKVEELENKNLKGEAKEINEILVDLIVERTSPQSKKLASFIHRSVYKKLKKKYRLKDRGIKPGLFYVLALAKIPAVLLEVGFLSNPSEAKKLLSSEMQKNYANAIANGVDLYFKKNKDQDFISTLF